MTKRLDAAADGMYVISATPFTDAGALDLESTASLMDFYLRCGVTGMTILGIMGEAPKLSGEESMRFVEACLARFKLPVIVGVSAAGLDNLVAFSKRVMDAGAAGVMVAPIAGLKTEEQITGYFDQVARGLAGMPWVLQDFPAVTTVTMATSLIVKMIADYPDMVMLKHEDWPGNNKITRLRAAEQAGGRRVSILIGNGGAHYAQLLARGVDGAMTGFAYPDLLVRTRDLFLAGRVDAADDLFDACLPLIVQEMQPGLGLAVRKYALMKRGAIRHDRVRAPGPRLTDLDRAEIDRLMQRLEQKSRAIPA
ncbi:MAG: dihydrodipicolinate synthase family protein [Burkholderiales bacterium]|nr:dihydrodipicolinate synthase family protein [Burkholderiales bacterium]